MPWKPTTSPAPVPPPAELLEVDGAAVTVFRERRSDEGGRARYSLGAVYSDGRVLPQSLRAGGYAGDLVLPEDPQQLVLGDAEELRGRWLYGGHWMGQFGHFITETLTSLWPDRAGVEGLLFHRFIFNSMPQAWQLQLLKMAGWHDIPLRILGGDRPLRVEQLLVPTRPYLPNQSAGPEAVAVWDSVRPAPRVGAAVFLSRSSLARDERRVPGDERLDDAMAERGFAVVHPQDLPVAEQVRLVSEAPIVAAVSGSALHLSAFAPGSARVLELGDRRTRDAPLPNQRVIDSARARLAGFVPFHADGETRDLKATLAEVDALLWL